MAEPVGFRSLRAYLYRLLQWVHGSGKDIEPPVQREAKAPDGMVLGSGHCLALGRAGSTGQHWRSRRRGAGISQHRRV